MNKISPFFLAARHWQVFLLLFLTPYIAIVTEITFPQLKYVGIALMVLNGVCMLMWYRSMGRFLASVVEPSLRGNTLSVDLASVYPLVYGVVFIWVTLHNWEVSTAIIVPFHLLAMACILYLFLFVAKNLAQVETRKPASFADYAGSFLLLWFFPIGVWIIQPKINALYAKTVSLIETHPKSEI